VPAPPLATQDLEMVLRATASLWEEVRGQRIFMTGGTGFFGCWLLESFCHINQFLGLNAAVTVLTRQPEAFALKCPHLASNPAVTLHAGDVRSFDFPEGEFPFLIHAATDSNAKRAAEDPLDMLSTIVAGTERALAFATTHGTKKFLLTSSGAVYGKQPGEMTHVPETYMGGPNTLDRSSAYSEGKRASELMCALYANRNEITCKIARCWAFCGPHLPLDQHFAFGNFVGDVLAGRAIQIKGDGTPRRSYLYAADLAIWLWTILFKAPTLVPFNVGSSRDVSILELAQIVVASLDPHTEILLAQQAIPGSVPMRYVPAVDRARELLGLRETVGLQDSIRRTAAWLGAKHR
jgi:nucleoside-diphosphate-sugar epimerase